MDAKTANSAAQLSVTVSEDRLRAWVHLPNPTGPGYHPPSVDDLLALLQAAQIELTDDVRARVRQFAELISSGVSRSAGAAPPELPQMFLIAEGRPPVEPEDEAFERYQRPDQRQALVAGEDDSVNYFAMNSIETVAAGTAVGRLTPPTLGVPGRDVFGGVVPPRRHSGLLIGIGPGLRAAHDRSEVVTETPGRLLCEQRRLWIEEVLEIDGDVNFDSGSLDVCVDVRVHGTVRSNFSVRTTKALTVDEAIEAAEVDVDGDIAVRGGICGHECRTIVRAAGTVAARFCHESRIYAGGDLRFEKECRNSRVRTPARLIGPRATIIGGEAWARESIEVGVIGSEAGVVTRVAVGIAVDDLRRVLKIEDGIKERAKAAERIRQRAQPLAANLNRLTDEQRRAAIELLSEADELESSIEEAKAEHGRILRAAQPYGTPHITVHHIVHPGVRIAIGARNTRIEKPIQGPVRIGERKVGGVTQMVAVDQGFGALTVLPSYTAALDAAEFEEPKGSAGGGTG